MMKFLSRIFQTSKAGTVKRSGECAPREGPLVHIFVFETGTIGDRDPEYLKRLVRSLVPESMAYANLAISFHTDTAMPPSIGVSDPGDLAQATNYPYAWKTIGLEHREFIEGLKVGRERYTFRADEYESDRGNRGILYAFYELAPPEEKS